MKQVTEADVLAEASRHATGNRRAIEASEYAGCWSCCATFKTREVCEWRDEWTSPERRNKTRRWTAKCPRCDQPTVIGSATGLLDDQAYLPIVNQLLAKATRR